MKHTLTTKQENAKLLTTPSFLLCQLGGKMLQKGSSYLPFCQIRHYTASLPTAYWWDENHPYYTNDYKNLYRVRES